jgi:hypothetical protein
MAKNMTVQVPPSPTGIYTVSVGTGGGGGTFSDVGGSGISVAGVGGFGTVNNGSGITRPPPHLYPYDDSVLNHFIKDHEIQGQTLMVEHTMPIYSDIAFSKEDEAVIKAELMEKIVHELVKAKCIEFTKMRAVDSDEIIYRARIHAVPDTQVRIIRELKNAGKTT